MMQIKLEGTPTAPRRARQFVQEHWESLFAGAATTEADVALVASELVTNAVEAGAHHVTVQISVEATHIELSVSDDADGWPTQRTPDPDDVRGRGLFIASRLASHWTATKDPVGKTITTTWARTSS